MICFQDRSFCAESDQCDNDRCGSRWTPELRQQAVKWWGGDDAPVAFMSMKDTCGKFKEKP